METVFLASEKQVFPFTRHPGCENSFSFKRKCLFNEFFIPASGNEKTIFFFRALLKLLKFGCASHLVEIFAINEWKLKRSILNRLKYEKIKLCYSSLLKHFSHVTFLRTILINANKIHFTR